MWILERDVVMGRGEVVGDLRRTTDGRQIGVVSGTDGKGGGGEGGGCFGYLCGGGEGQGWTALGLKVCAPYHGDFEETAIVGERKRSVLWDRALSNEQGLAGVRGRLGSERRSSRRSCA